MNPRHIAQNLILTSCYLVANCPFTRAADWGYEGETPRKSQASAAAVKAQPTLAKPKIPASAPVKTAPQVEKLTDRESWLEIFALMASTANEDDRKAIAALQTLSADQKERLEKLLKTKLTEGARTYCGIAPIWAPLRAKVFDDIDYKESYRLLFRALTRHWLLKSDKASDFDGRKAQALSLSTDAKQKDEAQDNAKKQSSTEELFCEILGPSMVAEIGPPPLTADAINAYGDMTCFLYQKKHPDKSIDQDDNRQIFANVIREKFQNAPDKQARLAMSNFDLTWACFRCRFLDSSVAEREKLSISAGAPINGQGKTDLTTATIHTLFKLGPWGDFNASAKSPQP